MIVYVFALLIGVLAGTFTGLLPGIHINLVATLLVSSIGAFAGLPIVIIVIFIVSMSIAHTFIDFIPSIFLGAPEEDSFLSVLPGHRMLKEGRGFEAFVITIYGSLIALAVILAFAPLYIYFLPPVFNLAKAAIPFILIFISLYLIFREERFMLSLIVFSLAGFLGFLAFNLPVKEPLMPLLAGMFGLSGLIISLKTKSSIQKQKITPLREIKMPKKDFFKSVAAVLISAPFCAFLPGIGSGHAATIGSEIIPQDNKGFLFLVGATNTIIMGLSFITLYAINKSRSGSAAAISELLSTITASNIITILITITIAGIISAVVGIFISRICAQHITRINYTLLTSVTIAILIAFAIVFSNPLGILVLTTSTALGVFAISSQSRRINLMGALIIPAILYYLL